MMFRDSDSRPYYYVLDRMYTVRKIIDRAGAIVESYFYDSYGQPHVQESCGRGDMNDDSSLGSTDTSRVAAAVAGSIWDPRADMDDDGNVDANDQKIYNNKQPIWDSFSLSDGTGPTVNHAFSVADQLKLHSGNRLSDF